MSTYFNTIRKHHIKILLVLGLLYIFLIPIGYNAIDTLGANLREDVITDDDEVLSFTSLTSDVILLVNGDENIISQAVFDWIASIAVDLQLNDLVHNSIELYSPIEHVFEKSQNILSPYLNTIFLTIALANVSTYVIIEGSRIFQSNWLDAFSGNYSLAAEISYNSTIVQVSDFTSKLTYNTFLGDFNEFWLDKLREYYSNQTTSTTVEEMISDWQNNSAWWVADLDSNISDYLLLLLESIDINTKWDYDYLLSTLGEILFSKSDPTTFDLLKEIFSNGNAVELNIFAKKMLIPFINGSYLPPGLSDEIREFYISTFTNSDGVSTATSLIIQLNVRGNLTRDQIYEFLDYMDVYSRSISEDNPFGYEVILLSQLFYLKERGENLSREFHTVDFIALIIGLVILLVLFRDIRYALVIVISAYMTSQVANAIIILVVPKFQLLQDASFSMATTIIMGATMNYSVFFAYRFREEIDRGKDHAVEKSISTALHSIQISSFALILTFLPLSFGTINIFSGLAFATLVGIFTSITMLSIFLPSIFFLLGNQLSTHNKEVDKHFFIHFKPSYVKKVILIASLLFIISIATVVMSGSTVAVEDFVGTEGQTGRGMEIVQEIYPIDYFSKMLVQFNLTEVVSFEVNQSTALINEVGLLSQLINETGYMKNLISIAWPLGESFDYDDASSAVIPRESAINVASQLVNQFYNQTFVYLHLIFASDTTEALIATGELKTLIQGFVTDSEYLTGTVFYGVLADSEDDLSSMVDELPIQLALAILLLTAFLFFQLRTISVPLRLEATILLSSVIALAIGTIIWLALTGNPLNLTINLLSLIVLLGLGTDFDIFIYRRIQEERKEGVTYHEAINSGIRHSSPAVIASGSVMAASFIALFWGNLGLTRQFGLVTFIAIMIDIFLVRLFLVPALLLIRHKSS